MASGTTDQRGQEFFPLIDRPKKGRGEGRFAKLLRRLLGRPGQEEKPKGYGGSC